MGKKFGFSWSWKRAIGVQKVRQDVARGIGIPTTKLGFQRKVGAMLIDALLGGGKKKKRK